MAMEANFILRKGVFGFFYTIQKIALKITYVHVTTLSSPYTVAEDEKTIFFTPNSIITSIKLALPVTLFP